MITNNIININNWIKENKEQFKPPCCNKVLFHGLDMVAMIVIGPNYRSDFHLNHSEVWFQHHHYLIIYKVKFK